jgi:hypothetical protein
MGIKITSIESVSLADALFPKVRQRVLSVLFGTPDRSFYANEVIALAQSGTGAVQRELADLSAAGLLNVTKQGNQKHYQANANAPVFAELRSLVLKSMGLADVLPAYPPDDKPLNTSKVKALRKDAKAHMPKGKILTKSTLFK